MKEIDARPREITHACYSVIAGALASLNRDCSCKRSSWFGIHLPEAYEIHCNRSLIRFPGKSQILGAARMLFSLDQIDEEILKVAEGTQAKPKTRRACTQLVPLLLSLARLQSQDLEQCAEVPLFIKVFTKRLNSETTNPGTFNIEFPNITESFEMLAQYLLGQRYSDSFIEQALLVSDWGWSIFFDANDATDPSDVSICNLRMLAGAPSIEDASRNRVVKDRILDGPTELSFSHSDSTILKADSTILKADSLSVTSSVNFFPGVSTARRGNSLIGFCDNDAFLATQLFTWQVRGTEPKDHILGFREMLELCKDAAWLPPCACDDKTTDLASLEAGQVFTIKGSDGERISPNALKGRDVLTGEYAICVFPSTEGRTRGDDATWVFHVTNNSAARWLQMDDMVRNTFFWDKTDRLLFIRSKETCMLCACKNFSENGSQNPPNSVLL